MTDNERVWGRPVRIARGKLTHWAGREQDGVRLLAHNQYAWTHTLREPLPDDKPCLRCVRMQPFFIHIRQEP